MDKTQEARELFGYGPSGDAIVRLTLGVADLEDKVERMYPEMRSALRQLARAAADVYLSERTSYERERGVRLQAALALPLVQEALKDGTLQD